MHFKTIHIPNQPFYVLKDLHNHSFSFVNLEDFIMDYLTFNGMSHIILKVFNNKLVLFTQSMLQKYKVNNYTQFFVVALWFIALQIYLKSNWIIPD